jgi:PAS domain S-box-containing protein
MSTSVAAVGLTALGSLGHEARRASEDMKRQFLPLARIVGANSVGAVAFDDSEAAGEILAALAIEEDVVAARLYTADGAPFATYTRAGAASPELPEASEAAGSRFAAGQLVVFEPILHDSERIGTLFMQIDTGKRASRLNRALRVLGLSALAATGLALLLSGRLLRKVSRPVLELAEAVRRVSERRDYSIRVQPGGPTELRELTVGFNEMLSQIQQRDTALRAARDDLEERVAERVRELAREVSERRRAEAESGLRAERLQLLGAALESTADAVAITDRGRVIEWVNRSFCSLMGYSPEELTGASALMFRSERKEDLAVYGEMASAAEAGEVWGGEVAAKRRDGELCVLGQTITPVQDAAGEVSHYVAVMRDISKQKRLEQQLRQAQKMEAIGRLSGGVAHDFNNILNVIIGFGELLLKKLPPDEGLRRYGREILKAGERAARLTRQLLAFSRQQILQPRVVDLNAIISDMQRMLARLIGEDIEVVTTLEPALGQVEVDPGQVEQVVMNLVVNARDAMPRGGTLEIETTNVDVTEADARRFDYPVTPGAYVRLRLSDTGTGMDEATLAHVFEPFFTTKPVDSGTGLGLATVYGIVKQSKGYVWVESQEGVGTSFSVLLPRVTSPAKAAAVADHAEVDPMGRETVLLVEDDPAARELWRETLELLGYRVVVSSNGVEALRAAGECAGRIDVLLSDVVMPKMGGRELAARLREQLPDVAVIFMSGYTTDTVVRQGISEGGGPFLQKPFTAHELARKIRDTLDDPRRQRSRVATPVPTCAA